MVLVETKIADIIDSKITENDVVDTAAFATVFSGTGAATGIQMGKIGDIYIKTDDSTVYIAKGTTKSTDWVQVSN